MKTIAKKEDFGKFKLAGVMFLLAIFVLPIVSFAKSDKIYVDDDATGTMDGSSEHPYKTISDALGQADKDDEVHIRSGVYKENIVIPKGVNVFGSGMDEVIIKAKDDNDPVVKMKHKTEINKVTIQDGKYGVTVGKEDRASIVNCRIKDNRKDGIIIKKTETDDKYKVSITESIIENNGKTGIYSEERRLVLIENEIKNNDSDGVDLETGVKAWIYDNQIKDNDGSGLKMTLDGSEIWTKSNTFRDNNREGIEVSAYGGYGRIDINKSKFYKNDRWGIARVQKSGFSVNIWNGLTIQNNNKFWENKFNGISDIVKIY